MCHLSVIFSSVNVKTTTTSTALVALTVGKMRGGPEGECTMKTSTFRNLQERAHLRDQKFQTPARFLNLSRGHQCPR